MSSPRPWLPAGTPAPSQPLVPPHWSLSSTAAAAAGPAAGPSQGVLEPQRREQQGQQLGGLGARGGPEGCPGGGPDGQPGAAASSVHCARHGPVGARPAEPRGAVGSGRWGLPTPSRGPRHGPGPGPHRAAGLQEAEHQPKEHQVPVPGHRSPLELQGAAGQGGCRGRHAPAWGLLGLRPVVAEASPLHITAPTPGPFRRSCPGQRLTPWRPAPSVTPACLLFLFLFPPQPVGSWFPGQELSPGLSCECAESSPRTLPGHPPAYWPSAAQGRPVGWP